MNNPTIKQTFQLTTTALIATLAFNSPALAVAPATGTLPTDGRVVVGTGTINQSGNVMTINQNTDQLAINWNTFNVGPNNTVNFVQPSSHSVALNRVLGSDVSVIQGKINANGYVALINPNGILFTPTAQVNVGGLVASTLNISNKNFKKGNFTLSGFSSNAVINQGNISVFDGGTVALVAAKIKNVGTIVANKGNVLFGAGSKVTLDFGGPVSIKVNKSAVDALIENGGAIRANGGVVYFTAKAANKLATTVINNTGIIEAKTLSTGEKGEIHLLGDQVNDHIVVDGTLDVGAPEGGDEGTVYIDAASIEYAGSGVISLEAITKIAKAADLALAKAEKAVAKAQKPVEKAKAKAKAQIAKAEKAAAKAKANIVKVEAKANARVAAAEKAVNKADAAAKKAADNAAEKWAIAKKTGTKQAWNKAKKAQVNADKKAKVAKNKAAALDKTKTSAKKSVAIAEKKAAVKSAAVKKITKKAEKAVAIAEKKAAPKIAKAKAKQEKVEQKATAAHNKALAIANTDNSGNNDVPTANLGTSGLDTSSPTTDAQGTQTPLLLAAKSGTSVKIQSIEDAPTAAGGDEDEAGTQPENELVITYIGDGINLPE